VLFALLAVPAFAGSTVQEGYAPDADRAEADVAVINPQNPGGGDGPLPFTGVDVALVGGAGMALLLVGLGMARATRRESRAAEIP
jgi:hypothetical protein